ncbi:hypothetical protein NSX58_26005, partial [Salmonella enterica]|nr:hypothetical protein [Salmonella enterica]
SGNAGYRTGSGDATTCRDAGTRHRGKGIATGRITQVDTAVDSPRIDECIAAGRAQANAPIDGSAVGYVGGGATVGHHRSCIGDTAQA